MNKKNKIELASKDLIIVRGIPNSGKTTFAHKLGKAVCSADDYFTYGENYIWKPEKVSIAHAWCQRKCRRFMKVQVERIIIANTSTTERELKPYMELARQFSYTVTSVIIETRHNNKNCHNVPETTLDKMRARFNIRL